VPVIFGGIFDVPGKKEKIADLESKMGSNGFWDDQESANKVVTE